jgi:hypothetical protein
MSVADTAKALTLSPITILRWIRLGKLPALKLSRRLIDPADDAALVEGRN